MSFNRYDPTTRFLTFRDAIDRMIDQAWGRTGAGRIAAGIMPVDMYEKQDELVMMAAVPGARPEDVDISVTNDSVTIRATVRTMADTEEAKGVNWYLQELDQGQFTRTLSLPFPVAVDRADARFEDGILHLRLPKSEEAKPRRIQVQAGGRQSHQIDIEQGGQMGGGEPPMGGTAP